MGEIWCGGVVGEKKAAAGSKAGRRKKMDGDQMMRRRRFNFHLNNGTTTTAAADLDGDEDDEPAVVAGMMMMKRKKMMMVGDEILCRGGESTTDDETSKTSNCTTSTHDHMESLSVVDDDDDDSNYSPKFGVTSVIGRRRDMEDAVAVHPSFCRKHRHPNYNIQARHLSLHYFGIYDGHGCSHVAMCCKKRMHEFVKEELERGDYEQCAGEAWKDAMDRSFSRMDREAIGTCNNNNNKASCTNYNSSTSCRCDLQMPDCDAVGSTAVVSIVTPDKIIVANCGDSRAVLCRAGKPLPLSNDHKPDRPDELQRIQDAGGRVIFWDGPRVLGVLAMSRAIGDNYLKPYVSSEPEVTVTERSDNDDCLILASDGLWDVVSNDTACQIARMCLRGQTPPLHLCWDVVVSSSSSSTTCCTTEGSDQACSDAALLLTKLALARNSTDNVSVVIVDLRRTTTTFNAC